MQILTERPLQNYAHDAAAVRRRSETYNSQENKQLCSQVPASHVIEPYGVCAGTAGGSFVEHVNYRCQSGSRHGAVKLVKRRTILYWIEFERRVDTYGCIVCKRRGRLVSWAWINEHLSENTVRLITLVCSRYTETQWRPGWHHWWQLQ